MMGREFERLFSSRVVRCRVNGAPIPNAFRENLRWDLSKPSAPIAANAWTSAQIMPFVAKKVRIVSIILNADPAAIAGIIVTMAHSFVMANQ